MTANRIPTPTPASEVRLCDHCQRPLPALDKNEYTPARAHLVAATGFCVCPPGGHEGTTSIPDHAPSLL
jgi:hypothetical protein